MRTMILKLFFLTAIFFVIGFLTPPPPHGNRAAISTASASTTATYQKGDGKGIVSETDDGTIYSRYVETTLARPFDFQGDGDGTLLTLRRLKETTGSETLIEVKRFLIKFPNNAGEFSGILETSIDNFIIFTGFV